jgi:hypothetical protein
MNHMARRRLYPQGCGQILWIPGQRPQPRALARPEARLSVTPSLPIRARLTAPSNMALSPNKYTSWGKLCGLRWEMQADLGIDCGRYVVIPNCPPSFAGPYAGAGETVPHRELRIRQLSPASTQPTTTYLYIFVPQDRQAIGTGLLGDNPTRRPRVPAPDRHPAERGRDSRVASRLRRGRQGQVISRTTAQCERSTGGVVVTCARHVGRWSTDQTISSRPNLFRRPRQSGLATAPRMMGQLSGIRSASFAGLHHRPQLRRPRELPSIRPRNALSASEHGGDSRRVLSDRRGKQDWCGLRGRPGERAEMTSMASLSRGRLEWPCDDSRRRFL